MKLFGLHAARVGTPDMLVQLQLHPKFHSASGDPVREFGQINLAPGRRDQDRSSARFEVVLSDHLEREVPVNTISDHELCFVQIGPQQIKIRPMISFSLARAGTLDVQNDLRSLVHFAGRDIAAGFDQDLVSFVAKFRNQSESLGLGERLTAGYFDESTTEVTHLFHHIFDQDVIAAGKRIFAVAPDAAHRAAGQPHECARAAGVRRFTLDRAKDFSYAQHTGILDFRLVIVDLSAKNRGWAPRDSMTRSLPLPVSKTVAATGSAISHQTSAAEIESGRRFKGIIVIGLARWLPGNLEDS